MDTLPAEVEAYWAEFTAASGVEARPTDAFQFGDSPEMADELLALVLEGRKRATAALRRSFGKRRPLPAPGHYSVVLRGDGHPACILRTTEVAVRPLAAADERFAWDEGEGDRTLAHWMDVHWRFFSREAEREGFELHPDIQTVFERFEVVWPPAAASRTAADGGRPTD